jgi:hypothetical protein
MFRWILLFVLVDLPLPALAQGRACMPPDTMVDTAARADWYQKNVMSGALKDIGCTAPCYNPDYPDWCIGIIAANPGRRNYRPPAAKTTRQINIRPGQWQSVAGWLMYGNPKTGYVDVFRGTGTINVTKATPFAEVAQGQTYTLPDTSITFTNNMRWVYGQTPAQGAGNGQGSVNGQIQQAPYGNYGTAPYEQLRNSAIRATTERHTALGPTRRSTEPSCQEQVADNRLGENHKTTSFGVGLARSRRI